MQLDTETLIHFGLESVNLAGIGLGIWLAKDALKDIRERLSRVESWIMNRANSTTKT